jgi:hypothetical protein
MISPHDATNCSLLHFACFDFRGFNFIGTRRTVSFEPRSPSSMLLSEALFKNLKARSIGPAVMGSGVGHRYRSAQSVVFYVGLGHGGIFKTNDNGVTFPHLAVAFLQCSNNHRTASGTVTWARSLVWSRLYKRNA